MMAPQCELKVTATMHAHHDVRNRDQGRRSLTQRYSQPFPKLEIKHRYTLNYFYCHHLIQPMHLMDQFLWSGVFTMKSLIYKHMCNLVRWLLLAMEGQNVPAGPYFACVD